MNKVSSPCQSKSTQDHFGIIGKVRFSHQEILNAIKQYAEKINRLYDGKELLIISVLTGAIYFTVHLTYYLKVNFNLDFVAASSYRGAEQTKKVKFHKQTIPLKNKNVLVLEDIVDGGLTMKTIMQYVVSQKPKTIRFCSLVSFLTLKNDGQYIIDYLFSSINKPWLVGFGFDYCSRYRNLPDIHEFFPKPSQKTIKN